MGVPEAGGSAPVDDEPPARFNPDAKAAWAQAPEPVRAEARRAITELEQGLNHYRERASAMDGLEDLEDFARKVGMSSNQAVASLWNANKLLQQDLIGGLDYIARTFGQSLQDIAGKVLGRDPNQNVVAAERKIADQAAYIKQLENQITEHRKQFEASARVQAKTEIERFKAGHPHFEAVRQKMARYMSQGLAENMEEAYNFAVAAAGLATGAGAAKEKERPAREDRGNLEAQTRRGSLSVSGAPSSGSDPGRGGPPSATARDAVAKALDATGH